MSAITEIDDKVLNANMVGQLLIALPPTEMITRLHEFDKTDFQAMPEGEQVISGTFYLNFI